MQGLKEFGQSVVVLQGNGLIIEKTESKHRWWGRKFKTNKNKKQMWHMRTITREWQRRSLRNWKTNNWGFQFHIHLLPVRDRFSCLLSCFASCWDLSCRLTTQSELDFFFFHNQFKVALRAKPKLNHGTCWIGVLVSKTWGRCHSVFDILESF